MYPLPAVPPWSVFVPNIDLSMGSLSKQTPSPIILSAFQELLHKYSGFSIIFTDGSKSPDLAGCAIVYNDDIIRISLPAYFTILSAELYAIKIAINVISSDSFKDK